MRVEEDGKGFEDQREMLKKIDEELAQAFKGLFKWEGWNKVN